MELVAPRDTDTIGAIDAALAQNASSIMMADVGKLASSGQWAMTEAEDDQRVWTDDYSNVLGAVWRRLRKGEE